MPSILSYGADPTGVADCTPALNSALTAAALTDRQVSFPFGTYKFNSQPNRIVQCSLIGTPGTALERNYNGDFLVTSGTGVTVRDLNIIAMDGTALGSGIFECSDVNGCADFHSYENITISAIGSGTWGFPLRIDGNARTIAPAGVRCSVFRNINVFGGVGDPFAGNYGVNIENGQDIAIHGCYIQGNVYVGGSAIGTASNIVRIDGKVDGTLVNCNAWGTVFTGGLGSYWEGCGGGRHVVVGMLSGTKVDQLGTSQFLVS